MLSLFLLALVSSIVLYVFYFEPKQKMLKYKKDFQRVGLRVYMYPFKPFTVGFIKIMKAGQEKGDPFIFFKEQLQGYDMAINYILNKVCLEFLSPDLIKEFCQKQREWCYEKNTTAFRFIERVAGRGVINSEGERWKKKRKILNQVFNFYFISSQISKVVNCVNEAFNEIQKKAEVKVNQIEFSIKEFSFSFTSRLFFRGFLGGNLNKEKIEGLDPGTLMKKLAENTTQQLNDVVSLALGVNFLNMGIRQKDRKNNHLLMLFNVWATDYIKQRIIEERKKIQSEKQNFKPTDVISSMLYHSQNDTQNQNQLVQTLLQEFKTLFLAGFQSTSSLFMSMIFFIYSNPQVLSKLKQQIQKIIGDQSITYQHTKQLKYLEAIQNETIRIAGPVNACLPRTVIQDHYFSGVKVGKGTSTMVLAFSNHFSSQLYPEPFQFIPERWLQEETKKMNSFALLGFHAGNRSCLGKHLALLETKISTVMFIKRYEDVKLSREELNLQMKFIFQPQDYRVRCRRSD